MQQVDLSGENGNVANRADADGIVNAVYSEPFEDSNLSVSTQQCPDVDEYIDTTESRSTQYIQYFTSLDTIRDHDHIYTGLNEPRERDTDNLETYSNLNKSIPSEIETEHVKNELIATSVEFKDHKEAYENQQFGDLGTDEAPFYVNTNDNNNDDETNRTQCDKTVELAEIYQN